MIYKVCRFWSVTGLKRSVISSQAKMNDIVRGIFRAIEWTFVDKQYWIHQNSQLKLPFGDSKFQQQPRNFLNMSHHTPLPPYGETLQKPGGKWRNGLCNCGKSIKWCVIGCFTPSALIYGIAHRTGNMARGIKILFAAIILCLLVTMMDLYYRADSADYLEEPRILKEVLWAVSIVLVLGAVFVWIWYIYQLSALRSDVRHRYGIHGSQYEDIIATCCCQTWCFGLQVCQMYYEIEEQESISMVWHQMENCDQRSRIKYFGNWISYLE